MVLNCVMGARLLEITDLLWPVDSRGAPVPAMKADVLNALRERGQRGAAAIVSALPAAEGILDPAYVDALGLRVHLELQRLGEELQLGRRVAALVRPVVEAMRAGGAGQVRVVDVGCGLGFVLRAMAASRALGPDVELVGVDLNPVLVAEARRLAALEGLACRFAHGDALAPGVAVEDGARTVIISTGFLHHLPEQELAGFFAAQSRARRRGVRALGHRPLPVVNGRGLGVPPGPHARGGLPS